MTKHYYTQAINQPYPFFFMAYSVCLFFLFHYSIWQRQDPSRNAFPFSELQFFQDFLTNTFYYLDPLITSLVVLMSCWILCMRIFESKRVLCISDEDIAWMILGYCYKTVVRCQEIQQIKVIEIPPQDQTQTVLLRFKTQDTEYDLKLISFDPLSQQSILKQLAQYRKRPLNTPYEFIL
ncbi:hypothetical protein [Acinetobacter sp. NCu2D-2]|uniref:hypothetical protein n=1 Tax=Acinetobacter sp. NCu2D-2 TaxID=1608473 RepID=UPI000AA56BBF|nr:hypothetical protein [Acinetobacter sp. NCu2D-2]